MIKFFGKDDGIRNYPTIEPKTSALPPCGMMVGGWPCENIEPGHTTHFVDDVSGKQAELMQRMIERDRS